MHSAVCYANVVGMSVTLRYVLRYLGHIDRVTSVQCNYTD